MGNSLGLVVDSRCATVMKVSGETLKFRAPVHAAEILKIHPGYVLLEAAEVKKFGTGTKPLGFYEQLDAKKLYFLVELPKTVEEMKRSCAEKKLEKLMVAHKPASVCPLPSPDQGGSGGVRRVTVRLSKEEYRKVMRDSKDGAEAAKKILEIYYAASLLNNDHNIDQNRVGVKISELEDDAAAVQPTRRTRERRVRFLDATEG